VQSVQAQLQAFTSPPVERMVLDDGNLDFTVVKDASAMSRVTACWVAADEYPNSGASLFCSDNNDPMQEALSQISEKYFQDRAHVHLVLQKVLQCYGIDVELIDPTPSSKKAQVEESDEEIEDAQQGSGYEGSEGDEYEDMDEDMEDAGDDDEGNDEDEEDEEERQLIIECGKRQGRWERYEKEVQDAQDAADQKAGLSPEQAAASRNQIFEPKSAFLMLSRELLALFRQQSFDMFVDSVGDDVYHWSVELASFRPDSRVAKDMQEIQRRHQYSTVRLFLSFKRGLHPFYPPAVELVRPHFKGCIATAISSHPMLKLDNWDPMRTISELISQIKAFIESCAQVDLDHPRNDINHFPSSSYHAVERQVARLEALTGVSPMCLEDEECKAVYAARDQYARDQARMEALADTSKKRAREKQGKDAKDKNYWARGTGYGHGQKTAAEPVWDARASEVAQKAQDEELGVVLQSLARAVARELRSPSEDANPSVSMDESGPSQPSPGQLPCSSTPSSSAWTPEPPDTSRPPDPVACCSTLAASCLLPFIVRELKAAFTDMCSRSTYYVAVLQMVRELCAHPLGLQQLCLDVEGSSVAGLVQSLAPSAHQYTRVTRPVYTLELEEQATAAAAVASASGADNAPPAPPKNGCAQQETLAEMEGGLRLADLVREVVEALAAALPAGQAHRQAAAGGPSTSSSDASSYVAVLKPLQVLYNPGLKDLNHKYKSSATSENVQPKARMVRLAKELSGLPQLLPLMEASSMFVRVDEENVTLWRFMITGPEDTPYSHGCFVFDMYFPPNYPSSPPQVTLKTTGGGSVRFNPNLYNTGKVCLSLLGTWEGGRGEGWNANASTALQVLLSIQSLILVPEPYFNEPGFERSMGTEQGNSHSWTYNKEVRENNIRYAMIDLLRNPPAELEDVIKAHFRLRRQAILTTIKSWIDEASSPPRSSQQHAQNLITLRDALQPLLSAL